MPALTIVGAAAASVIVSSAGVSGAP